MKYKKSSNFCYTVYYSNLIFSSLFYFYFYQVNTLGGDAERLQQTHPQNASQIHLKKDELVTNWEQIRTLAAERHARLNDSYR